MRGERQVRGECDVPRRLISLELDVPLGAFESRLLRRHLRRCRSCRGFARDVWGATQLLRSAPLEIPAMPVRIPVRQRRVRFGGAAAALGAVAALAVAAVGVEELGIGAGPGGSTTVAAAAASHTDLDAMRLIRAHELRLPASTTNLVVRVPSVD